MDVDRSPSVRQATSLVQVAEQPLPVPAPLFKIEPLAFSPVPASTMRNSLHSLAQ